MTAEFNGKIALDIRDSEPDWGPYAAPVAPAGAPNVLYLVWDDIGIATWDCFGGLVEMPAMSRIAEKGVRLSQFHTTALCSPTRAALLTGRNATTVGMATIEEFTDGFPNSNGRIPYDTALLPEVLAEHGYNTYCIGKWHLTPLEESSLAATKRHWPLGRGFERFYGFLGGETDQWYPDLVYDNHPVAPPAGPEDGYHLSKDLADRTIEFIKDSKVIAPDKPWFTYLCPGAGHAPHHVFKDWADRYAGTFDMGYERYREIVLENQKRLGIVPADTELSQINPYLDVKGPGGEPWPVQDTVRPWDTLGDEEKRLFARMAEVFAGFLTYTDAQIGRILDYLDESGQLDNTVIVVISDNGASGEGGPNGSVNESKFFNGYIDTVEDSMRYFDVLGSPQTFNHYPIGWAMAFNTPYKLFKRYASHEGGIADSAIISWPNGIGAHGEVRDNYVNVSDITPTVYDLLGITPPDEVRGIAQKPLDGVSFAATLKDGKVKSGKETQYYAMLGTRGIWHDGWFANTVHAASPAGWSHFDTDRWELFHIESDRSQCHDLAAEHPEKLEELKALWFAEAARYNGLPLADLNIFETLGRWRPYLSGEVVLGVRRGGRGLGRCRRGSVQTRCGPRRACAVRPGRPVASRLQLHGRGRAVGLLGRRGAVGASHPRRPVRANRHCREQPHPARRGVALRGRRGGRDPQRCARPSGQLRSRRCRHQGGEQPGPGGVQRLPGAVPVHRWNNRQSGGRHLGSALP
jgi:arylsulfatase